MISESLPIHPAIHSPNLFDINNKCWKTIDTEKPQVFLFLLNRFYLTVANNISTNFARLSTMASGLTSG